MSPLDPSFFDELEDNEELFQGGDWNWNKHINIAIDCLVFELLENIVMSTVLDILKNDNRPKQQFFLSVGSTKETIELKMLTTGLDLPGFKIVESCGIARGITVRSRSLCSNIVAVLCSFGGGRNAMFTHLCEQARDEALQLMIQQTILLGGNAVIGFRYESHDVLDGITEVLAYGTAVLVEQSSRDDRI